MVDRALRPWLDEPDATTFESSGYRCDVARNPHSGTLNGYVTVDETHPWYGLATDARVEPLREDIDIRRTGAFEILLESWAPDDGLVRLGLAIEVHGGVTFAGRGTLTGPTGWSFGFDCGHAGDYMPLLMEAWPEFACDDAVYRDLDYVTGEVARMAAQLRMVARRGAS
jgi:hypothetical protein